MFNRGPEAAIVTATFADLGLSGSLLVRDLWLHKDLGRMSQKFSTDVPRHGAVLIRIGQPKDR